MHTLSKNIHHNERLIYDFLEKAYPNGKPTFDQLVADNIINGTQICELAINRVNNIGMCPIGIGRDYLDDSDAKTVTVQENNVIKQVKLPNGTIRKTKTKSYTASIEGLKTKIGLLRIICYNPFLERYHYFRIPKSAVYELNVLKITFDQIEKLPTGKYAQFEVDKFEDIGTMLSTREVIDTILSNVDKSNISTSVETIMKLINLTNKKSVI